MTERIQSFINKAAARLEAVGIDQAKAEVELILCYLLDCKRLDLYMHGIDAVTPEIQERFEKIMTRRLPRYPLQFILNEAWFYGRTFYVNEHVMAPTPETEMLVETALRTVSAKKLAAPFILDVGVGSGVISITLALECESASITAVDISRDALEVAQRNAATHGVGDRITFIESDFFSSVPVDARFDLIVSNPPYIAEPDYASLDPEVKADPKVAMTSGVDGLDAVRIILRDAPNYLEPGGTLMFEIGVGQADTIAQLVGDDSRYDQFSILRDLNDRDRVVILRKA